MGLYARKPVSGLWEQHRHRPACAYAQVDILIFLLVSITEETGLKFALSENLEEGFSPDDAHVCIFQRAECGQRC